MVADFFCMCELPQLRWIGSAAPPFDRFTPKAPRMQTGRSRPFRPARSPEK